MELLEALNKHWGYEQFRPNQEEAMTCVLGDQDSDETARNPSAC